MKLNWNGHVKKLELGLAITNELLSTQSSTASKVISLAFLLHRNPIYEMRMKENKTAFLFIRRCKFSNLVD